MQQTTCFGLVEKPGVRMRQRERAITVRCYKPELTIRSSFFLLALNLLCPKYLGRTRSSAGPSHLAPTPSTQSSTWGYPRTAPATTTKPSTPIQPSIPPSQNQYSCPFVPSVSLPLAQTPSQPPTDFMFNLPAVQASPLDSVLASHPP